MKSIFRIVRVLLSAVLLSILAAVFVLPSTHAATGQTPVKKAKRKQPRVLYAPIGYEQVSILLSKGRENKYYLFSRETPLKLELEGPTTLRFKLRILYDMTMQGNQNFSVVIEEEGMLGKKTEVALYWFTAEKSRVSTLKGESGIVPSKAYSFKLVVPKGKHRYTLSLKATAAKSAAIRILIPKRDVQTGKKGQK